MTTFKTEAGFIFCKIQTKKGDGEDQYSEWEWTKAGFELDIVTAFWEIDEDSTKIVTCDGDIYCVNIPFDIFSSVICKHRTNFKKIYN